ncbi:hypothetical protein N7478_013228 [Penicillium angulare]|uniref:uncharacterized protein n=1 Tax=Penicillium angulare TaxID=116970 RepID=UPI00253F7202|nr:uncharacterized protein N7478_013228 [Penicillium angulare]KAJ5257124.1 hypothetical protein N7478_013228 [Penicillium angulare]
MADKIIVAFDMYGTLLSTDSISKQLEIYLGSDAAPSIATLWRRYQLEYTWRLNSMEQYEDFAAVTRNSLRHALNESGQQLKDTEIESLIKAYDSLHTFPDVGPALNRIANNSSIRAVIFSNGTKDMISNSVLRSADLSKHASIFSDLVTVDEIRKYKPSPITYQHVAKKVGKELSQMGEIWLVSSNPFDIVGARTAGMNAIWVDRAARGWQDAACPGIEPTAIVHSLEQIVTKINSKH